MKRFGKQTVSLFLLLALLFSLFGCTAPSADAPGSASNGLDLDFMGNGDDPAQTADQGEGDSWIDWVAGAFNFSGEGQKENTPSTQSAAPADPNQGGTSDSALQEYYNQGQGQTGSDASGNAANSANPANPSEGSGTAQPSNAPQTGNDRFIPSQAPTQGPQQSAAPNATPAPTATPAPEEKKQTVTMSIRCDTAVNNGMHQESRWAGIVPPSGVILNTTTFEIEDGDTAFDVLCKARDTYKLHMQYSGTASSAYIQGINNLYEFDGGRWSGWMYCVNGWYPNYGCGQYVLKAGDKIEWNYTCDLGIDLGSPIEGAEEWKETHD